MFAKIRESLIRDELAGYSPTECVFHALMSAGIDMPEPFTTTVLIVDPLLEDEP